jgi:hypothetical protein
MTLRIEVLLVVLNGHTAVLLSGESLPLSGLIGWFMNVTRQIPSRHFFMQSTSRPRGC